MFLTDAIRYAMLVPMSPVRGKSGAATKNQQVTRAASPDSGRGRLNLNLTV